MARNAVLVAALGLIGLLAFLTLSVLVEEGLDPLVMISLVVLAVLAFGVLGALTAPPDD
jgi:hypothetical protein